MTASIEQVRAGIMTATDKASGALGALQQAYADLEETLGMLMHVTEGSPHADVSQATGLLKQAMDDTQTAQQATSAGIQQAEAVAARL